MAALKTWLILTELILLDDHGREVHPEDLILAFSHYLLVFELDDIGIRGRIFVDDDPEGVKLWLDHAGVYISRRRCTA